MGVYIRDMDMPKSCHECRFYIENIHDRGDDSLCRASGKEVKCGCPLVHMNNKIMLCEVCFMHDSCEYSMPIGKRISECPYQTFLAWIQTNAKTAEEGE